MATLQTRLAALAQRLGQQCKALAVRSLPAGGDAGAVLTKAGAADYAATWTRQRCGFAFPCRGKPDAGELLGPFVADVPFTIPANLAQSIGQAVQAFTAVAVFSLLRNGAAVGSITFAANGTQGALATATAADIAVARGDVFWLQCPAQQDATGADIGVTIHGLL